MGRLAGTLFGIPFAAVGVFMLVWIGNTVRQYVDMQAWIATEATVIDGGYRTLSGDDSDTYKAYGEYRYRYEGRDYVSTRVAMSDTADNIGSFQQELGRRLRNAAASGTPVTAWVNPADPADAVISRDLRIGFQAFKAVFGVVFGAVGFGVIFSSWRVSTLKKAARGALATRSGTEWLANPDWNGEPIRSEARGAMHGAWLFASIWNLVALPVGFLIFREFQKTGELPLLLGLLFPVVGMGLAAWAVRITREWWRFGPTPVTLDPFPGSIGGQVGGRIDLNAPMNRQQRFDVTLTLVRSYDGSESRTERVKWQRTQRVGLASHGGIDFRLDVPEGLGESDADTSDGDYHLWRLHVMGDMDGPDFDRKFVIPVYATAEASRNVAPNAMAVAEREQARFDDDAITHLFRTERQGMYSQLIFPPGRHLTFAGIGTVFGGVFGGIGVFLLASGEARFIGAVFALVGGLILLAALYSAGKGLRVTRDGATIRSKRSWLGLPLGSQQVDLVSILNFEARQTMSTSSGGRHTVYYTLYLVDESGKAIVGEGLKGHHQ
ncbi:MAG: DUF3592 domain-containing protein, partial [Pseudomonadota bacterium]